MSYPLQMTQLLMQIFPQLTSHDFKNLNPLSTAGEQLQQWLEQHDIAKDYLLECEFSDWANSFDLKLNLLDVNAQQPIAIDSTLDQLYDFFEEMENELEDYPDFAQEALFNSDDPDQEYLMDEDDVVEEIFSVETIILQNLLNCILRNGLNVLLIEYPERFQMILNRGKSAHMQLLQTLLQEDEVNSCLYLAKHYHHGQFPYLIGKF